MRKKLIHWLFEISKQAYTKWFKKNHIPWQITVEELLLYPKASFGYELGCFLEKNQFQLLPKVEKHDAYLTLTGYGTRVEEEITLQYLCLGNGKNSPYMYGAIILGTLILPEYISFYWEAYSKGLKANTFHHYDYEKLLTVNFEKFKTFIFQSKAHTIHNLLLNQKY
jgi:ubiquinone biosynthesis protein Coq4